MKLLYLLIFYLYSAIAEDRLIKKPDALSLQELNLLDEIFEFENVDETMEHFDDELDVNFLKSQASSSGYVDENDTFKLVPCLSYFSLFKKINGQYSYFGKILYPAKHNRPSSIYISQNGDSFISVFTKYDKKAEEYEYKLYVWLKDRKNMYRRFYLGYINAANISSDGSSIVGFNSDLKRGYLWRLKNNKFELVNDSIISNRSNRPLIGINKDGSRFFILDKELAPERPGLPIDDHYLELDIFDVENEGTTLNNIFNFYIPATRAIADLNSSGNQIVLSFMPKKSKISIVENAFCTGVNCSIENILLPKFLIINLNKSQKTDLLYYANLAKIPDRLKVNSQINSLLLGFDDHLDFYEFKVPELQKIMPESTVKINCSDLLSGIDDQ
jgi:hypothetical protein